MVSTQVIRYGHQCQGTILIRHLKTSFRKELNLKGLHIGSPFKFITYIQSLQCRYSLDRQRSLLRHRYAFRVCIYH